MHRRQAGFALLELLAILAAVAFIGVIGWLVFGRSANNSHQELNKIINQIILPSTFKPVSTTFSTEHPEFSTIYLVTRSYQVTAPITRAEALQQIVKSLGLNPSDHQAVNIYDEQLNGVTSPLYPSPKGTTFSFFARLSPSYDGYSTVKNCEAAQEDTAFRACINNDPRYGKDSLVKTAQIEVDKE